MRSKEYFEFLVRMEGKQNTMEVWTQKRSCCKGMSSSTSCFHRSFRRGTKGNIAESLSEMILDDAMGKRLVEVSEIEFHQQKHSLESEYWK